MTWEEINKCFEYSPIWIDWYCTRLELNALSGCSKHEIYLDTINKFSSHKIDTCKCNNNSLLEDWIRVMKLKNKQYK